MRNIWIICDDWGTICKVVSKSTFHCRLPSATQENGFKKPLGPGELEIICRSKELRKFMLPLLERMLNAHLHPIVTYLISSGISIGMIQTGVEFI